MNVLFDIFGQAELPAITLCNPNKSELFSLGLAYDTEITLRFNALSEFKFSFPEAIDGGEKPIEAYYYLKNKRLVKIDGFGYFQIVDVQEKSDGAVSYKVVSCMSLENELVGRRVSVYSGTKKLYDPISPQGTILGDMVALAPNWSIETVDGSLLSKYRTFNVSDTNIYNFLINDVSNAFECVFSFDTDNRTIRAYALENAVTQTDIFMSYDNLIISSDFSEKSDEITTCLSVYGGGDLSIRGVNPLGTNKIYNFNYFKNTQWMSQDLINQITAWENTLDIYRVEYGETLVFYKQANSEMITLRGELAQLQAEYAALEQVQAVRIQAGEPYDDIIQQMADKQAEIDQKNVEITNKQTQIDGYVYWLNGINSLCSFEQNFTVDALAELQNFIYENTYKNDNIIQTDNMSAVEVQDAAQSLFDQAEVVLAKISSPRYEITIDSANYINQEDFSTFTSQTQPGCSVVAEIKDINAIESLSLLPQESTLPTNVLNIGLVTVVVLEISFSFDDPEKFSITFSNRLRLDGGDFVYSDLVGQTVRTGATVAFDGQGWSNWENNYKDDVSTFITSSLNAANNNIISSVNQDIKIDQTGLRARKYNESTGQFEPEQVWLTNNVLAFSSDGFNSANLALGKIQSPTGGYVFGLVADAVVGRLLAGNSLTISNENNNFILDSTGAYLNNAKFSIQTTNTKVIIDPTSTTSFRIQKNVGGTFTDKFWVDNVGNVNFSGTLSGATGTFSGSLSAATGTFSGQLLAATGTFAGSLSAASGTFRGQLQAATGTFAGDISAASGVFSGNIYANKIYGEIVDTQVAYGLNAGKVTFGTMSADRIYGGTITWPGASLGSAGYGYATLIADVNLNLYSPSNAILESNYSTIRGYIDVLVTADNMVHIEGGSGVSLYGPILSSYGGDSGWGVTGTINPNSYNNFYFVNGILVDYY